MDSLYQGPHSKPLCHLDPVVALLSHLQDSELRPACPSMWPDLLGCIGFTHWAGSGCVEMQRIPSQMHEAETGE